jgi:hypothetical protein
VRAGAGPAIVGSFVLGKDVSGEIRVECGQL